jgi:OHCU decarboxylase
MTGDGDGGESAAGLIDLASRALGGSVLVANDETYAEKENLIKVAAPTFTPATMGPRGQVYDGWETRRRRGGGCDWLLLHLGAPGQIRQVSVDTMHFVGNSPGAIRLTAVDSADPDTADVRAEEWPELLPRTGIQPDTRHWFGRDAGLDTERTVDRVRAELIPDGGLSRLRLWGVPSDSGRAAAGLRWWNLLPVRDAARQVRSCCSAPAWAGALADERPVDDVDALCAASERITLALPWDDVLAALAGHARIGQAPTGKGREAASSRQEQTGVADDPALHAALDEGNRAYEQRFGHVYLVRAAGRSGEEMLALLRERLGNDDATERDVVRRQLAEITSLRLRRLWCEGEA